LHSRRARALALGAVALASVAGTVALHGAAPGDAFSYRILSITNTARGAHPVIVFAVVNPDTGEAYDLKTDPEWTQIVSAASRLFLQIGWDTREFTNRDSDSNSVPGGTGAAQPIPINALAATVVANGDGTYTAESPLPIPATASGTGTVAMEGHPAGQDATGAWTVRLPVRSVYKNFTITDATVVPRRNIVDVDKCRRCHRSDGSGVAPRLTAHGNNRTEEPQVCVLCHNPNNTDIPFRLPSDPEVVVGPYSYPEQSIDFKRLVHGIHASAKGFRENPLVVIGRNHTVFDASTLSEYPTDLKKCAACHVDDGRTGTFELPLAPTVLGSTFDTGSVRPGGILIDADPGNDVKISPIAATCSSCHDHREVIAHMRDTGGATFTAGRQSARERCATCHGPGRKKSVRKVHQ
jgi:OmcA/MtrC family decaheme c-type cytochrome